MTLAAFAPDLNPAPEIDTSTIVVSPWSIWYPVLDTVADSVNPLLAFFAIVAAIRDWRRSSRHVAVAFGIAAALGVAGIYTVRALVKLSIWHALGGHYSTHAAFATSIVISLAFWLPRRRVVLNTVLLAYEVLILIMGYHSAADVLTASVVACVVTVPWHLAARSVTLRRGGPERSAASVSRASDELSE